MKRVLWLLIVSALVGTLILSGCSSPDTAPATPGGTEAPAPPPTTQEPAGKPLELSMTTFLPPIAIELQAYNEWMQKVSEATNGMVTITLYPASQLLPQEDTLSGTAGGVADIGHIGVDIGQEEPPLNTIITLPFLPLGDWRSAYSVWTQLLDEVPEMSEEYDNFKVLFRMAKPGMQLHNQGEVRVPDDLKGVQMFASGSTSQVMDNIGASPIFMPPQDWLTSLDRGLITGMVMSWDGVYDLGLYPYLPDHTTFPSYVTQALGQVVMNIDVWNSLSPEAQKAFVDLEPWVAERTGSLLEETYATIIATLEEDGGHSFVNISPEEERLWFEVAQPVHQDYLDELEAQGLPARAIYERALEIAGQ